MTTRLPPLMWGQLPHPQWALRRAGGLRTKLLLGNEQGGWRSGDRVEGRKCQSGENAFILQTPLSIHKVPSTEEGFHQQKDW